MAYYVSPTTPTFERDRIRALKNERITSQKKTFTKWINSFLSKAGLKVNDLFQDLSDGKMLISLLETISGEKIGVGARGRLRVHKIENVHRALLFLQKSVKLESIGAEDVVDGNERLILGLIWMIILRFQIADISYEDEMSKEKKSAKEALLLWCQRMTRGYPGVDVKNFTTSWRNGLAFNALIHKHRPDLINFPLLKSSQHEANLNNAFNVAEERLGITRLLDAEDVDCPRPDDKSVMTYVSMYYQYFAKMKSEETGGRRIAKIISLLMEIEEMEHSYERMITDLLNWINAKITDLGRRFQKSMVVIQHEMAAFKYFRTVEKPSKYSERVNIEAHLFSLQTKRKANNQRSYVPPEGKMVKDINRAWQAMETAEHDREMVLREELIRQEMLEKLAVKFERKATLRESWLDDMMHVLEEEDLGPDAATVEAALKRHEAISTDVKAREERFQVVFNLAQELIDEDYYRADVIRSREEVIMTKWDKLLARLESHRNRLVGFKDLVGVFREIDSAHADMSDIEMGLRSEDYGRHLLDVENLLQKHSLVESQIQTQEERVQKISGMADKFVAAKHPETKLIIERQSLLSQTCKGLVQLGNERRARLEDSLRLHRFFGDVEEEEIFIKEGEKLLASKEVGKDLISLTRLQQRHEALEAELSGRFAHCETVCAKGQSLINRQHFASREIKIKIKQLQSNWINLKEMSVMRKERLKDAAQSLKYYSDANDAESWLKEKKPVVCSEDYGRDEQSAMSLLQRHVLVEEEIKAFADDIARLKEQSKLMGQSDSSAPAKETHFETYEEEVEVETDEEFEQLVEKEVIKDVVQEVTVPQVRAVYPYTAGQGLHMAKGEVLFLIGKTNKDWWSVRRLKSKEAGYVPANYVKEIEPRLVKKTTKQKVLVPEKVKSKRKVKKKVKVQKQRLVVADKREQDKGKLKKGKQRRAVRRHFTAHFDRDNVSVRQMGMNNTYNKLLEMAQIRRENLESAMEYYHFCHDSDDFETWMKNKYYHFCHDCDDVETRMKYKEKQLNVQGDEVNENVIQVTRKKLERFATDLAANSSRVNELNSMADKLLSTDHPHFATVKRRKKEVNERWGKLLRLKQLKEDELEEKHGVELFFHSCDEMKYWMKEKDNILSNEDVGRDMETVRALQRRHQGFERDLAAVDEKIFKLQEQAKMLVSHHPRQAKQIKAKEAEIIGLWSGLKKKANRRKNVLDEAYGQQGFLADSRDLLSWASDTRDSLRTGNEPHDIASANKLIQENQEKMEDIQTHNERFDQLIEYGKKLLVAKRNARDVKERVAALKQEKAALRECWSNRNDQLQEGLNLQVFIRDAEHVDSVTASQLTFVSSEDLGSSVDDVERLLKQHEDFEKTLMAQNERRRSLSDLASGMAKAGHVQRQWIAKRKDDVVKRREQVMDLAKRKHQKLLQSQVLQNFQRDVTEFDAWINEKMQIATDDSYRDPSNVQGKLQRHQAFEAEISANKDGIDGINTAGSTLVNQGHFGSDEVLKTLNKLNQDWKELVNKSTDKAQKLQQAQQQQQFNRVMRDTEDWMNDVETLLSSEDLGRDLSSVKFLLKKQHGIEADTEVRATQIQELCDQAQSLIEGGHFDSKRIELAANTILDRFDEIREQAAGRTSQLEDSLALHQFIHDIEVEMSWIREHMGVAASGDLGTSLVAVQRLQKRHQAFENELVNHQSRIVAVLASGQDLIDSNHYASDAVDERCEELSNSWEHLIEVSSDRKHNLDEALEAQKYFTEANEVDSWMNDKGGLAASQDFGKDEASVDKLLTKQNALETDVLAYSGIVQGLAEDARRLVQSGHFDAAKIAARNQDIEEQMSGLQALAQTRRHGLEESKKLHQFLREAEETADLINDQLHAAAAEDYGKDFEHLETIQSRFEDFKRSVNTNAEQYSEVDSFAERLITEGHTNAVIIEEQQEILRSMWDELQEQIAVRTKRLASAAEIHRFNRDLNELLARVQEKEATLSLEDLGRDLASVQALQRKHEGYERDLLALEQQVKTLSSEAAGLQAAYQGQTAQSIKKHEEFVLNLWEELQRKKTRKKRKLQDAYNFHKLSNQIRDLVSWCIDMSRTISSDEPVHSFVDAETLLRRLDEYKSEMDAREDSFNQVLETGENMIEDGHFAADELTEKLELLLTERECLYAAWEDHKMELDQAYDMHVFLRDAKQIDTLTSSQEAVLAGAELGDSVDEVESLLKKHENTEKLVTSQDDKVLHLCQLGEQLTNNGHCEADRIRERLVAVCDRRNKLKQDLKERKGKLFNSRKIAQFYQDVVEAESWITEKLQTATDESYKDPANLESKLQKHQAFEAELTAHEESIDAVRSTGEELITSGHFGGSEVENRIEALYIQWEELLEASANKGRKLEEARDHQKFNQEVDIADSCISDKEAIVSSEDTGQDFEHCVRLQKKMREFDQDLAVDAARVDNINRLADKLMSQGHAGSAAIYQRQQALNERWNRLQDRASERRQRLAETCEIHAFNRDCTDVSVMMSEKLLRLSSRDFGKDLPGVEALLRKHDDLERDLTVIEDQMEMLDSEANRLVRSQPHMAQTVQTEQAEIIESWERLNDLFDGRKEKLEASRLLQIFLLDYRDLTSWMTDLSTRMSSGDLANGVKDAEALLELHKERKGEIDAKQESFSSSQAFGMSLVEQGHFAREEITDNVEELGTTMTELLELWREKEAQLDQTYKLQVYLRDADQAKAWISAKDTLLQKEDLDDSLDAVETLLRSQVNFDKSLAAYEETIKALEHSADQLTQQEHYDSARIRNQRSDVMERWQMLKKLAVDKSGNLGESKLLFQFLRNAKEMESWMNEKLQSASEASYREVSNLQQKLQKHQTFEAELSANKGQLDAVLGEGRTLQSTSPKPNESVTTRIKDLADLWQLLTDMSANKGQRLKEAIQKQTFERNVSDLETWIDEVEKSLLSRDYGKDVRSVTNLLKKHQLMESHATAHEERVTEMLGQAKEFVKADHFQKDEIDARARDIAERFQQLSEPLSSRREMLDQSLLLQQFLEDLEEELAWIREKEPVVKSDDLGRNMTGVLNLLKKHEAFESEMTTHEQLFDGVLSTAGQLMERGHYASDEIEARSVQLQEAWDELQMLSGIRQSKLQDSLTAHQFLLEISEVESWVQEKLPQVSSQDYGRDETTAQSLLRKHEAVCLELESYESKVKDLEARSREFVTADIQERQTEVQQLFVELSDKASSRHRLLIDSCRLFNFLREVDEVESWIDDKSSVATSNDYGRDLEHVETLLKKFENFTRDLVTFGERVDSLTAQAQSLLDEGHSASETIKVHLRDIHTKWNFLKERTHERLEALGQAKEIHTFNRNVQETEAWIQEKEAALTSAEDGARDLSSVQALQRKHHSFQLDLKALGEKVEQVSREADELTSRLPEGREHVEEQKNDVVEAWRRLQEKASSKRSNLSQSQQLQEFLNDFTDLLSWMNDMTSLLTTDGLADDVTAAETQLTRHQEYRAEIDTRQKVVNDFQKTADKLIADRHSACADIEEKVQRLQVAWHALQETWQDRLLELEQNKEVQLFKRDAAQLEAWMKARENDVESEDVGDTLEAVEELLKKQDEFEKMLLTQERKFLGLGKLTQHEVDVGRRRGTNDERMQEWEDAEEKRNQELERKERDEWERREREELERREEEEKERREREEMERREVEEKERREREELERREVEEKESEELERREVEEKERREREEAKRREVEEMDTRREEERREREELERREKEERNRLEEEEIRRGEMEERKRKERVEKERERKRQEDMVKEEAAKRSRLVEQEKIQHRIKERQRTEWERQENLDKNRNLSDDTENIMCEGFLQRKQEYEAGARKTHARTWKTFYTVLRGTEPELVFFKDKKDVHPKIYAAPSMIVSGAWCEEAKDYTKRKHVFRLVSPDDAEFLFIGKDSSDVCRWVEKIARVTGQMNGTSSPPSPQVPKAAEKRRFRNPLITVTSIDNEDEPVVYDEDTPSPLLDIPPPVLPQLQEESPDELDSPDVAHAPMPLDPSFPYVPDILPEVAPFDFSDLEDDVDEDFEEEEDDANEIVAPPQLPTSPPPPLYPAAENDFGASGETNTHHYHAPSTPAFVPTQFERPSSPPRTKHKVPPPVAPKPEGRERSGTEDSCSSTDSLGVPKRAAPKPPVKPKPAAYRSATGGSQKSAETHERAAASRWRENLPTQELAHDEKKQEKRKGMFSNIFKKRDKK